MPDARTLHAVADVAVALWIVATFLLFYLRLAALLWAEYGAALRGLIGEAAS